MIAALLTGLALATSPAAARFSGTATLEAPGPASADARFTLAAELLPGDNTQAKGRYTLDARIGIGDGVKAALATDACATDLGTIFSNSFE